VHHVVHEAPDLRLDVVRALPAPVRLLRLHQCLDELGDIRFFERAISKNRLNGMAKRLVVRTTKLHLTVQFLLFFLVIV
jgi:hypothetical protein